MSKFIKITIFLLLAPLIISAQSTEPSENIGSNNHSASEKSSISSDANGPENIRNRVMDKKGASGLASSVNALSRYGPGAVATGLLGYFKLAPDFTQNRMSFGYFSSGRSSGYIASYTYNFGYDLGKFGELDIDLVASKIGSSRYSDRLQLQPNVNWQYSRENFNFQINVNAPPIVKSQDIDR